MRTISAALLLIPCLAAAQSKPLIDNERVVVTDASALPKQTAQQDTVVVHFNEQKAEFVPKGKTFEVGARSIVIALKDHAATPLANKSGFPNAFPRPGSKKLVENARVIVWDYAWTPGVPTPMHFHDKDVVVTYLDDGTLSSTTPDGKVTQNPYTPGTVRFNLRDRTHTEVLTKGKQHAIMMELK